jgi:DNA-binding MarR family transcriptional regulator
MASALTGPAGISRWEGEIGDTISEDWIAEVRARPRFQEAMRHSVERALAMTEENPVYHTNVRDAGRMTLAMIALYLDATGGLTHRRLREMSGDLGMLSAGRATAILFQLRMIGYVTPQAVRADGAATLYVPTAKMRDAFRARVRIEIEAMAKLEPEAEELLARFDEDETFRVFVAHFGSLFGRGEPREDLAALNAIAARNSGMLVLFNILHNADTGGVFPPSGRAPISVSALSRRFGVSRAHVARLLREIEQDGFITRDMDEDSVTLLPILAERFSVYFACIYIIWAVVAHRTIQTLRHDTARAAQ